MSNKPTYPDLWLLDIHDTVLRDMFLMMYKNMQCNLFCSISGKQLAQNITEHEHRGVLYLENNNHWRL